MDLIVWIGTWALIVMWTWQLTEGTYKYYQGTAAACLGGTSTATPALSSFTQQSHF